jgi:hypothetical protein
MNFARADRDTLSAGYFDGAAQDTLVVRRCCACLAFLAPHLMRCTACESPQVEWAPVAGEASLVSWSVAHQRPAADGTPVAPTVLGLVELDEGPWLHVQLGDVDPDGLAAGNRFRVAFHHPEEGESLPYFRPAEERP